MFELGLCVLERAWNVYEKLLDGLKIDRFICIRLKFVPLGRSNEWTSCGGCSFSRLLWYLTQDGVVLFCIFQESIRTKHPQLLYESKLYRILQGGSKNP